MVVDKNIKNPDSDTILKVEGLSIGFNTEHAPIVVVEDVSFEIKKARIMGLVGESGCGKSVTAMSIMRLLASPPSFVKSGKILFEDRDLLGFNNRTMRKIRGNSIGMIFQEPMTSLNPCFTIGYQIGEVLSLHQGLSGKDVQKRCMELLDLVGIGDVENRLKQYPHQLSGGLRQRVMIAMALACNPKLLIADEPTTALDVTIQAQILDLLIRLKEELSMSILMITHDLGVVAEFCDDVSVMYAGKIVEQANVISLFENPRHPYTRGLLSSIPKIGRNAKYLSTIKGMVPGPENRPQGCYFADRCERKIEICSQRNPGPNYVETGKNLVNHTLSCWNPYEQ
ncbi:MAG: ABC transporter ATP-binding protein [Desulfobacula sp.]|nr:ABC transporter ATP-binding protein [Desulfobacula sp.]